MSQEIEQQLQTLQGELKGFFAKAEDERKNWGKTSEETASAIANLTNRLNDLDMKLVQLPSQKAAPQTLAEMMKENEGVQRMMKDRRGRAVMSLKDVDVANFLQQKTTITSSTVGFPTAGVMPEERGRYVEEARTRLRMRDVIPGRSTVLQSISWPKASDTGTKASPVAEAALKPANNYDPTMVTERVKTIATYFDAGRQVLEDWSELGGILNSLGSYKVQKEFDRQVLFGDNTGENLNGLTTQAQSWDLSLMSASDGYKFADIAAGAFQQVEEDDEVESDFFVLSVRDWWRIQRTKDTSGMYLIGDPRTPASLPSLWGKRVVATNQMTNGYFLAGSSSPAAAEIRDRMGLEIELSTEHANNFTYNLVTIRFELRAALCVYRPNAFVYGAFTQSPA